MLLLSAPGRIAHAAETDGADSAPAAAPKPQSHSGWFNQKVSLLYKNADGDIVNELPLSHAEEGGASRATVRDVVGEMSANGRFAYTFDKTVVWNGSKTKVLEVKRMLRVYGSDGKLLWESPHADAPEGQAPLLFSADGEIALVLLHKDKTWTASVRDYLGATLMEAGPLAKIEAATLTPNGRYAMVRWLVLDQAATHTFLDIKNKVRKDVASGDLYLGAGSINEDGKVFSAKKLVFDFNAPAPEKKP